MDLYVLHQLREYDVNIVWFAAYLDSCCSDAGWAHLRIYQSCNMVLILSGHQEIRDGLFIFSVYIAYMCLYMGNWAGLKYLFQIFYFILLRKPAVVKHGTKPSH